MLLVRLQRALGMASERARLAAAPLLVAGLSCSFPAPEACSLACGDDGGCPGGFECQASSQRCVPRGMTRACTPTELRPNQPRDGDDAGMGGVGPARDAAAGAPGAGEAGSGGAAGASSLAELSLLATSLPESACTGVELGHTWRASGGVRPYAWRVVEAPPGVRSAGSSGDEFGLGGEPLERGRVLIELQDASGQTLNTELIVHGRPEVSSQELPALCAGGGYGAWLEASGGERESYAWSATLLPGSSEAATLDDLGLRIEGSRLTGDGVAIGEEAAIRLSVDVRDAHCRSSAVELELEVASPDSPECPSIEVVDGPSDGSLPPPCLGSFYVEALTVVGGQEPHVWSEVAAPPGLRFDADTATVHGIAEGDGVLSVEVTDQGSRTVRKSYVVEARDRCWLAFVASEPAPARLALVDARRVARHPESARRTFPEEAGIEAVFDFQFSPDGRFIAYRLGAGTGALRLELARLSNGRARALAAGGSVAAYAWSRDSRTLAFALESGVDSSLGGVDISAVEASSPDPGAALEGIRQLTPVAAPLPDSALAWYAEGRLAFLARDGGAERRLVSTLLQRSRFTAPALRGEGFSSGARLLAGGAGVFVAEPATGLHEFFAEGVSLPTPHAEGSIVAPSGALAGFARAGTLQFFPPARVGGGAGSPALEIEGCTSLLAWAGARERVACVHSSGSSAAIAWFDASAAGDAVASVDNLRDEFGYAGGAHVGQRRALSPSGRWFAFTTRDDILVARVEPAPSRLRLALPSALLGAPISLLSFSPDENFLAVGAANSLGLIDLGSGSFSFVLLSSSAVFSESCSERFVDGAADWCGAPSREPDISWSTASDVIAFRSSLGTLQLIDVSRAREGVAPVAISPDACLEGCSASSSARFQP